MFSLKSNVIKTFKLLFMFLSLFQNYKTVGNTVTLKHIVIICEQLSKLSHMTEPIQTVCKFEFTFQDGSTFSSLHLKYWTTISVTQNPTFIKLIMNETSSKLSSHILKVRQLRCWVNRRPQQTSDRESFNYVAISKEKQRISLAVQPSSGRGDGGNSTFRNQPGTEACELTTPTDEGCN